METKLISVTKPNIEGMDSAEDLIAYCARVSNPSNQMNTETAPNLIKYLIKHQHWSPFEMVNMCVEIKTSRAIAAQILRHRSFSFQEFSQRYSNITKLENIEWRKQGKTNRQVGDKKVKLNLDQETALQDLLDATVLIYNQLIKNGMAKECARMILPLCTETTMYMNGSVRSWIHYLDLRCNNDTQKEHRDIANNIKNIFSNEFPNISASLNW